eukprot:930639-Amphidinium_carterae.1
MLQSAQRSRSGASSGRSYSVHVSHRNDASAPVHPHMKQWAPSWRLNLPTRHRVPSLIINI